MIRIFQLGAAAPTGTPWQAPQRTLFVSPTFSNVSPFFSNIQDAITAADGVNRTEILIYPGNYQQNLTLKNAVYLRGIDRKVVFIDRLAQATILPTPNITTAFEFGVRDVTLFSATATIEGIRITLGAGSTLTATIVDVDVDLQVGNSSGLIVDNNVSGSNAHRLSLSGFNTNVNGNSSVIQITKPFNQFGIDRCSLLGGATRGSILATTPTGALNRIRVTNSVLGGIGTGSGLALIPIYELYNCLLVAPTVVQVGGSELIEYHNCQFIGQALDTPNGGTIELDYFDCTFESQVANTLFLDIERTTMVVRAYGCSFNNGRIKIGVVNPNSKFVDCQVRNPGGTKSIESAVAPTVFLGNFTADKPIDATIIQAAGSFNVQPSVAI